VSIHQDKFKSSIPDDAIAKSELEVPDPMIAVVATAVSNIYSTLDHTDP
jgi:hypothetical protein